MSQFLVGIELELPVTVNGNLVAAADLFPFGSSVTKERPLVLRSGVVHPDAMALEFAAPPAENGIGAVANLRRLMDDGTKYLMDMCPVRFDFERYACGGRYTKESLRDPASHIIGCSPSKRPSWYGSATTPKVYTDRYRFSGLHITITANNWISENTDKFATICDYYIAVPFINTVLANVTIDMDMERLRRSCYGLCGEYRHKEINGVKVFEYRVLSSAMASDFRILAFFAEKMRGFALMSDDKLDEYFNSISDKSKLLALAGAINSFDHYKIVKLQKGGKND